MAIKKNRGGFIKPSAKKWSTEKNFKIKVGDKYDKVSLKTKQALANKYLKSDRENLGVNHKIYISTMNKVRMFQVKHGQTKRPTLSLESLKTGDIEIYNQLLDSIIDSTYTNPQKYEQYKEQQLDFVSSTLPRLGL